MIKEITDDYIAIPNEYLDLVLDSTLDPYDFRVLMMILWKTSQKLYAEISLSKFGSCGMSKARVIKSIKNLLDLGLILKYKYIDLKNVFHSIYFMNGEESQKLYCDLISGNIVIEGAK